MTGSSARTWVLVGVVVVAFLVSNPSWAGVGSAAPARSGASSAVASNLTVKSTVLLRTSQSVSGPLVLGSVSPDALAYDPVNGHLYVADHAGVVWVLIASTAKFVSHAIVLRGTPSSIAIDTANDHLFVVDPSNDQVAVVNGSSGSVITRVGVGPSPVQAVFDPSTGMIYVANSGANNLTAINGSTDAVSGSLPAGTGPTRLAWDGWNGRIFVSDGANCPAGGKSCNVTVVDPVNGSVVSTVIVGGQPSSLAFDNQTGNVFVGVVTGSGSLAQGRVSVIGGNTSKSITSVGLGAGTGNLPSDLAFDYRDRSLYVPEPSGRVGEINATSPRLVANLSVPAVSGVTYDPVDDYLQFIVGRSVEEYTASPFAFFGSQSFQVAPTEPFFNPTSRQFFALDSASGTMEVYNSKFQSVASYTNLPSPQFYGLIPQASSNPNNGNTYVPDGNGNIEVLSWPTPGVSTINDSHYAVGVAFDPTNGDLYAANFDGNVTVYHAATQKLVATIGLSGYTLGYMGAYSFGVSYDAFNGKVYATLGAAYTPSSCSGIDWIVEINPANNSVAQVSHNEDVFQLGAMAVAGSAGYLYVTDNDPNCGQSELEVFQTSNLSYVGAHFYYPRTAETSIAFDKANGDVYLLAGGTLYRIDGNNTSPVSLALGGDPTGVAYDAAVGEIAVTDTQSGTIVLVTP